jgi:hypothetical protein
MLDTISQPINAPEAVRRTRCSLCWAPSLEPCQRLPRADHLQRWLDAYQAGRISKAALGEAIGAVVVITRYQVIPERAA